MTLNVQHLIENVVEKKKLSKNKEKKIQKQNLRQKKIDRRKNVANIEGRYVFSGLKFCLIVKLSVIFL